MNLPAIPVIRVETAGNDVTYWLPVRPLGRARWFGLILVGFSWLWLHGLVGSLLELIRRLRDTTQPGFEYFSIAFHSMFMLVGFFPAVVGCFTMFGQCRVMWRNGRLTASDFVGPLGWRRRLPAGAIRKFTVVGASTSDKQPAVDHGASKTNALLAEFESGRPRVVVMGYPREWLEAIASELSSRVGRAQATPPQVEVKSGRDELGQLPDVMEKPVNSPVVLQRRIGGISLEIPPAGLRKGSVGFFGFAVFWCIVVAVMTAMTVFGHRDSRGMNTLLILSCPWAIGLALLAFAINLGRRRSTLTVTEHGLVVLQSGPFGTKSREFRRDEIAAIRADASGIEVNGSPVIELQIHPAKGKKIGLLAGRDVSELRWMAMELRSALGVAARRE